MKNYKYGIQKGIPIFLGYLPVSFTFGFMAVSGGLPVDDVLDALIAASLDRKSVV